MKQPINEIKRMQQLAGIISENNNDIPRFDLDNELYPLAGNPDNLEELKQIIINKATGIIKYISDQFGTNTADGFYLLIEKAKVSITLDDLGEIYNDMQDFLYINTNIRTSNFGVGKKDKTHHQYGEEN